MAAKVVIVGGISLLRSFSPLSLYTIVATHDPNDPARFSRDTNEHKIIADPIVNPELVVKQLIDIAGTCSEKPVLYYGNDVMLLLISRNRKQLNKYYHFLMPDEKIVEACSDKQQFVKLIQEHNLPAPKSLDIEETDNCNDLLRHISFPVVIKPLLSTGKIDIANLLNGAPQKVLKANNCFEFEKALDLIKTKKNDFSIQEFIPGGEEEIFSYHTFADDDFTPLASYIGKKIRTYPSFGGVSTYVELINEPVVEELGSQLIHTLNVKGPVKIDFKRNPKNGKYYLLELNLRFNLWNHLGAYAGINLAEIAYLYNTGQNLNKYHYYETGIKWLSFGNDFRAFTQYYKPEGKLTFSQWLYSLKGKKVYHIFSWRDPLPFIARLFFVYLRKSRKLFRRLI